MENETRIIGNPEFLNIVPFNPLISQCEIKVCYEGDNRNGTVITKDVLTKMANSLPGNPIVGYYKKEVEDFRDHGDRVIIDEEGLRFECLTQPYGFVAPDAKVWFQKFEEFDEKLGKTVIRDYLMTTGYLWTGQFPECKTVVDEGRPQSMEIDKDSITGQWAKKYKNGLDFFIINDGIFSKLCILGEDVEPCFEGASISAPSVNTSFTNMNEFKQALISMAQDLKFALKGEQQMPETENIQTSSEKVEEQIPTETFAKKEEEEKKEESSATETKESSEKKEDSKEDEDKKKDKFAKEDEDKKEPPVKEKEDKEEKPSEEKKEEDEDKKKYSLLEKDFSDLKEQYALLQSEIESLREFKKEVESKEKDALINSFYMLSDEDKKEVIENKSNYSLDDIEAKLSVICVRKKVNFNLDEDSKEEKEESPITTFNLESQVDNTMPEWIKAVINTQKSKEI